LVTENCRIVIHNVSEHGAGKARGDASSELAGRRTPNFEPP